jgi:hypothetical protein
VIIASTIRESNRWTTDGEKQQSLTGDKRRGGG